MKVLQKDVFPEPELPMRRYMPRGISPLIKRLAPGKTSAKAIFIIDYIVGFPLNLFCMNRVEQCAQNLARWLVPKMVNVYF
jgi:hypothetical protein